jgi:hypothetical protein
VRDCRLIPKRQFWRGLRVGKGGGCARFPDAAIQRPRGLRLQIQNPGRGQSLTPERPEDQDRRFIQFHSPCPAKLLWVSTLVGNCQLQCEAVYWYRGRDFRAVKRRVNTRRQLFLRSPGTNSVSQCYNLLCQRLSAFRSRTIYPAISFIKYWIRGRSSKGEEDQT